MQKAQRSKVTQYVKMSHRRSIWRKAVRMMAGLVVFCTTYALILPAITAEKDYFCGKEVHEHTDVCYVQQLQPQLICAVEEHEAHSHGDACYQLQLICSLAEQDAHSHAEGCYEAEQLICSPEEREAHAHGDGCYGDCLICTTAESAGHVHEEACYEMAALDVLTCETELHSHTDTCLIDPNADMETQEEWEKTVNRVTLTENWAKDLVAVASTQVGYKESENNYLPDTNKGYTRYGDWYGIPYGQWDAMFASFCLNYAEIPEDAIGWESDTTKWLESLRKNKWTSTFMDKVPGTGDLLFYRESEDAPVQVAIVLSMEDAELKIIEGDRDNQVARRKVALEDIILMGCCGVEQVQAKWDEHHAPETEPEAEPQVEPEGEAETEPEVEVTEEAVAPQQMIYTAETENYMVTVTCGSNMILPEGAQLRVSEYAKDSDTYRQRCQEAGYELEWLLNIGFFLEDQELKLDGDFVVTVASKEGHDLGRDITHFAQEGTEHLTATDISETAEDGQNGVSFQTGSFSDFGGGVALAAAAPDAAAGARAAGDTLTGFQFVTADPNNLKANTDYVIYTGSGTAYNFMSSHKTSVQITGTDANSPYQVGKSWGVNASTMGTSQLSDMSWQVVKSGTQYYLVSQSSKNYLKLNNGWSSMESQNNASRLRNSNVNGAATRVGDGTYHIRYENNEWKSTWTNDSGYWTEPTTIYFAEVTPVYSSSGNYPDAVYTGSVHVDRLRFYNLCEKAETGVSALAGCVFQIEGTTSGGQRYSTTIVSGDSPQIALPSNIPDGKFTITEVSAPDGYMRDINNVREFWIENGALVSEHNIGTFLNHSLEKLTFGKTGEVEDYNSRIYQILLNAKTNLGIYKMDPIEVLFVVDKSNSMLFPSGMNPVGKTLTLGVNNSNNVSNNRSVLDSLDKNTLHYIIADPEGSATVYAIWHDGTAWLYQDASYYAKAKFNNADGYESAGETVIFPGDRAYSTQSAWEDEKYGEEYRSNGGGLNHDMTGSTLGTFITNKDGTYTFQLYTAKDQYNRLHYLEEALANMIYELADANPANKVTLIPFTKEVQTQIYYPLKSNTVVSQPVTLTTSNAEMLCDIVTHIDTSGGTRQDLALEYAYETYLQKNDGFDKAHTYTILITDGAPVRSGSSAPALGHPDTSQSTTADNGDIYGRIKGWGAQVRSESTLMTVALGMEYVEGGKKVLKQIASSQEFYCALDDASALTSSMQRILFAGMKRQGELTVDESLIEDEISDSFYPIAWISERSTNQTGRTILTRSNGKYWLLLQSGDWITLEGEYTTAGAANAAGQLLQKDDGTYFIRWQKQVVSGSGWNGTLYVKAKEDFIGGNAIDTNKSASITVHDITLTEDTPTVNVHLLDLNEHSSEVTVYLGDLINAEDSSPRDVLKTFYDQIGFTKVQDETGIANVQMMNARDPDASATDGLQRSYFYLKYALGYADDSGTWIPRNLTDDEWATLEAGGSLNFPYVYDNASSHGDVGYFTVSLTKTSDTYDTHVSTVACQPGGQPLTEDCDTPVEEYVLTVTYTAYELGEQGRPESNVNNGTGDPGTEVTKEKQGLNNGQGVIFSENIHQVHVISGKILAQKIFAEDVPWTAGDTFTFLLTGSDGTVQSQTVEIDGTGTATAVFDGLARGTYTVSEATHTDYAVKSVALGTSTNSYAFSPDPMQMSFTMGHNWYNQDVIGKAKQSDLFTSYIDPVNGVLGEAIFTNDLRVFSGEIPVEKIWDDGAENHTGNQVYLVLYLDDQPVMDTNQNARILRLDAASDWKGSFTVVLADETDSVDKYNYSVREVSGISEVPLHNWGAAVLENDGTSILYYDVALADGGLLGVNGKGYIVRYAKAEDGTFVVTNLKSFDLPETGGMGTSLYTISGLAALAAALVYGYDLRRKRERGASG